MNLLRVAMEDSLDVAIRQVAAITFKNATRKDWDPIGDLLPYTLYSSSSSSMNCECVTCLCCTLRQRRQQYLGQAITPTALTVFSPPFLHARFCKR